MKIIYHFRCSSSAVIYINPRRSRDPFVCLDVWMFVCLCFSLHVSSSLHLVRFEQLLRCADKSIVNIIKMQSRSKGTTCKLKEYDTVQK